MEQGSQKALLGYLLLNHKFAELGHSLLVIGIALLVFWSQRVSPVLEKCCWRLGGPPHDVSKPVFFSSQLIRNSQPIERFSPNQHQPCLNLCLYVY